MIFEVPVVTEATLQTGFLFPRAKTNLHFLGDTISF